MFRNLTTKKGQKQHKILKRSYFMAKMCFYKAQ